MKETFLSTSMVNSVDELDFIQKLIEILNHSEPLEDYYRRVIEVLKSSIKVDRIAILLFDHDHVMRFKASIGLSERYRDAVEGHSPWSGEDKNPQPVFIKDAFTDPAWSNYHHIFRQEGVCSIAFIPLIAHENLIGKFVIYCDSPHQFTQSEVKLTQTIAHLVGYAVEKNNHLRQLAESNKKVEMILENTPDAFYALSADWKFTYVNSRARELWGLNQNLIGQEIWKVFPDAVGSAAYDAHLKAVQEGVALQMEVLSPILHRWIDLNLYPNPGGLSVYFRDIHVRKETEKALAEIQRRSVFLAEAGNILASSLEYETTLQALAELSVPELADGCAVQILEQSNEICTVAVAHVNQVQRDLYQQLRNQYLLPSDRGPVKVIRTGVAELVREVTDSDLRSVAVDEKHLEMLRAQKVHSYMVVPLVARGRTLGALTFISISPQRRFTETDLILARALASRAALAVDNARLYQESKEAHEVILAQLKEKEILIKEIHHRVKNNLQIISSLLNLQAAQKKLDPAAALKESQYRVRTMALIHEKLYQSDLSRVDLGDYIRDLSSSLFNTFGAPGDRIKLKLDCEQVFVDLDKAVPCGLIVNEILSNSLKHAFPENRRGEIYVNFYQDQGRFRLQIGDNGGGIPSVIPLDHNDSLGLRLISMLVRQLDGQLNVDRSNGTQFDIVFS